MTKTRFGWILIVISVLVFLLFTMLQPSDQNLTENVTGFISMEMCCPWPFLIIGIILLFSGKRKSPTTQVRETPFNEGSVPGAAVQQSVQSKPTQLVTWAPVKVEEAMNEAFRSGESADNRERQKSIQHYTDVVHEAPTNRLAWFNMGVIQSRMGNWQEAIHSFSQAQDDPGFRIVAAFAKLKLMKEKGQQPSETDLPEDFRGEKQSSLGVQGFCQNAANEFRNRGYTCTLEPKGNSCSIQIRTEKDEYVIAVSDFLGRIVKNVYRKEGDKEINLGDLKSLSDKDREIMTLNIVHLPLAQAPVSKVTDAEASHYRTAKELSSRKVGPHGWVRAGRSFDEMIEQAAADAKQAGIKNFFLYDSIENIAKKNCTSGTFFTCCLNGEPHALAMPMDLNSKFITTIKHAVEGSECVFRAEFFTQPEYPLVHIGLGLPVKFLEESKINFAVVENVANFIDANFQDWVEAIETKRYTVVDVVAKDGKPVASGRTILNPKVISEIVGGVTKANEFLMTIPQESQNYQIAITRFFQEHPEPFIWSQQPKSIR